MSADLQWAILRNNSCFLVKKDGYEFTSEPGNLNQKNSFKFSGLANTKVLLECNEYRLFLSRLQQRELHSPPKSLALTKFPRPSPSPPK